MATPLTAPITGVTMSGNGPRWMAFGLARGAGLAQGVTAGRQLLQVEPGAEGGIGAREDDGGDVVAPVELEERGGERLAQLAVQRVACVGSVERDGGDVVGHLHEDQVGHGHPSSSAGRKSSLRSPRRTSVDAIHPPMAEKWSSRMEPSASVASSSS